MSQTDMFGATSPSSSPVGLIVKIPFRPCRACGSARATVESSRAMHPAELRCECGTHNGWLSKSTYAYLTSVIVNFGRPTEPVVINHIGQFKFAQAEQTAATGVAEKDSEMDKKFDQTNRGQLFREEKPKDKSTDRDYSGSANINGTEFWVSGWIKEGKTSGKKFLSLSYKPKNEAPAKAVPFNDSIEF
jgi:hypothetical protein